jgi:CubicO group peptidase (beta-lactamase class C family)
MLLPPVRSVTRMWVAAAMLGPMALALAADEAPPRPAPNPLSQAQALRMVDAWLGAARDFDRIPALSAGVVRGQELVWAKGYGFIDAKNQVPATARSIYSICSISKLFTAVAVMRLVDARKLRLDDELAAVLPGYAFTQSDPDSAPISVRSVLTHSAGLPREADFPYWTGPEFSFPSAEQLRERLAQQATLYRSDERFQYSNLGMALLGNVVALASGQSYEQYMQANILDPLGLRDTRMAMPMDLYGKQLAVGHGALKRDGTRDLLAPFNAQALTPAAGFTSTVEDMARFASWQFRLLRRGGSEILRASTLREMQRVQWTDHDNRTTWGLGFAVRYDRGRSIVSHAGSCPGYRTALREEPGEELAIIVMANAMVATAKYSNGVSKIMAKARQIVQPAAAEAAPDLEQYAGRYAAQPWDAENIVLPWGRNLALLSLPSDDPDTDIDILRPTGPDVFREVRADGTLGAEYRFERDALGKPMRLRVNSNLYPRLGAL